MYSFVCLLILNQILWKRVRSIFECLPKCTCIKPELHWCCWFLKVTHYYCYSWENTVTYLSLYVIIFQALPRPAFIFMPLPGCFMLLGVLAKHEVLNFCYNLLSILFITFKMQIYLYCKLRSKHSCLSYMDKLFFTWL